MIHEQTLAERVSDLEVQVGQLSKEVFAKKSKPGWVVRIVGSMENDPDFAQILKLGKAFREAQEGDGSVED